MFQRIKSYIRDIRINLDFPQFESQRRNEYEQQAERRFLTKQLNDEKNKLFTKIESQASAKFDALLHEKEAEKRNYEAEANDTESLLSFFLRHYKRELDELYGQKDALLSTKGQLFEKKSEIRESLSEAFEEKDKAYSELKHYKDQIDSWYSKSDRTPWLFGNAGKKLPKHSLFGQSFGDLDTYKYHRDSAYSDVREAKNRIGDLKHDRHDLRAEIEEIKEKTGVLFRRINQVKNDRSKMYDLKKAGYNKNNLQSKLDGLRIETNKLNTKINEIIENKKEFIVQEKHRYGVMELEAKIMEIDRNKKQFLDSFDLDENQRERKRLHREIWLKQRGVA